MPNIKTKVQDPVMTPVSQGIFKLEPGMKFMTREVAKRKILEYVEMYYNRKRAHSTLGYLSHFEYEKSFVLS